MAFALILSGCSTSQSFKNASSSATLNKEQKEDENIFYSLKEDLMTDRMEVNIDLLSETTTANSIGVEEQARIGIRCKDNELKIYVETPTYNADNTTVEMRWNGGTPTSERWSMSNSGTFFINRNPQQFIYRIMQSETLVFQWRPYSTAARAVKFDISKIRKKIPQGRIDGCPI